MAKITLNTMSAQQSKGFKDQTFFYRQTPVDYDGVANIKRIKGNTISYNQLVQNGNFVDTSGWSAARGTLSVSNNEAVYTITTVGTTSATNTRIEHAISTVSGHIFYCRFDVLSPYANSARITLADGTSYYRAETVVANQWTTVSGIGTAGGNTTIMLSVDTRTNFSVNDVIKYRNVIVCDLTLMGIDNLTTRTEVVNWLSSHIGDMPYYSYTLGTLIPFNGSGLKTVGKNLWSGSTNQWSVNTTGVVVSNTNYLCGTAQVIKEKQYTFSCNTMHSMVYAFFYENPTLGSVSYDETRTLTDSVTSFTFTAPIDGYVVIRTTTGVSNLQLEFGSTATDYELYTSNTLPLPTLTYFPTGMKSAGSVYDEISQSKATTRIGRVDLGSLEWTYSSGINRFYSEIISYAKIPGTSDEIGNIICGKYSNVSYTDFISGNDKQISLSSTGRINVRDTSYGTDASAFKSGMSGQYLYYEKATSTETSGPDLSYLFEGIGTEQILPVNTSSPTTSMIIADIEYHTDFSEVSGDGEYNVNDTATLTATAKGGNIFIGWYDGSTLLSTDNPYSYTVTEDKTITGRFVMPSGVFVKVSGEWKPAKMYVKDGSWN